MKKFFIVIMTLAVLTLGCAIGYGINVKADCESEFYFVGKEEMYNGDSIIVIMDRATGIEYIAYKQRGHSIKGLCPRYQPDGSLFKAD